MELLSLDELDIPLAWARTLRWARGRTDVSDRMPFEVVDRLRPAGPALDAEHHVQPVIRVMASKGDGTARPFVRLSPIDLCLYQALVDSMAPAIEGTLLSADKICGYRQTLSHDPDPFKDSPTWATFIESVRAVLDSESFDYALRADIASFFVYVEPDELERQLLEVGTPPKPVRDLGNLLRGWAALGVRGLPQGVFPSSALGNLYLSGLDGLLDSEGHVFRRYVDDLWVFVNSFSEGREVLDLLEKYLLRYRLTLGGGKTRVIRRATALSDTETARATIERRKESVREDLAAMAEDPYIDSDFLPDPDDVDLVAVTAEYEELAPEVLSGTYPDGARSRMLEIYRELEALGDPLAVSDTAEMLLRFPDLTAPAMRYVAATAQADLPGALRAFFAVLDEQRFHREQELLGIFRAALRLPNQSSTELAGIFERHALSSVSELAQARALLAWGAQSDSADFAAADSFWSSTQARWRAYVLVAIQSKDRALRNERYQRWSGEARFLRALAESIQAQPFQWRRL